MPDVYTPTVYTPPKRVHTTAQFGAVLRRAQEVRGVTSKELAADLGIAPTTLAGWRSGKVVPLLRHGARLAELLDYPSLAEIIRELRTTPCPVCGALRVHGSNAGRYCGRRCQNTAHARAIRDVDGKPGVLAQHRLKVHQEAIDELCRKWCEPDGLCRDASCPIQKAGLSPLPLARNAVA